jgi:hypothetical protein
MLQRAVEVGSVAKPLPQAQTSGLRTSGCSVSLVYLVFAGDLGLGALGTNQWQTGAEAGPTFADAAALWSPRYVA